MEKLSESISKSQFWNTRKILSSLLAVIGTLSTWLFGEWDLTFKILSSFMIIDYIIGVIVAYINGKIDSRIGFKGILKKVLTLVLLIVGVLLDRLIGSEWTFRTAICYFLIGNEGWSIIENIGKTGIKIPNKLKMALTQLMSEEDVTNKNSNIN